MGFFSLGFIPFFSFFCCVSVSFLCLVGSIPFLASFLAPGHFSSGHVTHAANHLARFTATQELISENSFSDIFNLKVSERKRMRENEREREAV